MLTYDEIAKRHPRELVLRNLVWTWLTGESYKKAPADDPADWEYDVYVQGSDIDGFIVLTSGRYFMNEGTRTVFKTTDEAYNEIKRISVRIVAPAEAHMLGEQVYMALQSQMSELEKSEVSVEHRRRYKRLAKQKARIIGSPSRSRNTATVRAAHLTCREYS